MISKNSQVWQISSSELEAHLTSISSPDGLYWDSRQLKKDGQKFQSMPWGLWRKPVKIGGKWYFEELPPAPVLPSEFMQRIKRGPACSYIDLIEVERDLYAGCGLNLARVVSGVVVELFQLEDFGSASEAIESATDWISRAEGEVFLVECSTYQFCKPCLISDEASREYMKKMVQQAFQQLLDYEESDL